jgi:hypothetical protein
MLGLAPRANEECWIPIVRPATANRSIAPPVRLPVTGLSSNVPSPHPTAVPMPEGKPQNQGRVKRTAETRQLAVSVIWLELEKDLLWCRANVKRPETTNASRCDPWLRK